MRHEIGLTIQLFEMFVKRELDSDMGDAKERRYEALVVALEALGLPYPPKSVIGMSVAFLRMMTHALCLFQPPQVSSEVLGHLRDRLAMKRVLMTQSGLVTVVLVAPAAIAENMCVLRSSSWAAKAGRNSG